jgi:hypothetical protein
MRDGTRLRGARYHLGMDDQSRPDLSNILIDNQGEPLDSFTDGFAVVVASADADDFAAGLDRLGLAYTRSSGNVWTLGPDKASVKGEAIETFTPRA